MLRSLFCAPCVLCIAILLLRCDTLATPPQTASVGGGGDTLVTDPSNLVTIGPPAEVQHIDLSVAVAAGAWQRVPGTAHVYRTEKPRSGRGRNSSRYNVWVDDTRLRRVATRAAADATPGSFVDVRTRDGDPVVFEVHPPGSTNPNTDGRAYRVSFKGTVRVKAGDSLKSRHVRRNVSNNGAITGEENVTLRRVVASAGTKHNLFLHSGLVEDAVLFEADTPFPKDEPSNSFGVAYRKDATGLASVWRRVHIVQPIGHPPAWTGIYTHSSNDPARAYERITIEGGSVQRCRAAYGGVARRAVVRGNTVLEASLGGLTARKHVYSHNLNRYADSGPALRPGALRGKATLTMRHNAILQHADDSITKHGVVGVNSAFKATIEYNTLAMQGINVLGFDLPDGAIFRRNLVIGPPGGYGLVLRLPQGASITADYNVYFNTKDADFQIGDKRYKGKAWVRATGQDRRSVMVRWNDFWLGIVEGTSRGPLDGDFRINPNATTTALVDGTKRTGVFADGETPITEAGVQQVWHAKANVPIRGVPTRWPHLPTTLQEALDYATSPVDWPW